MMQSGNRESDYIISWYTPFLCEPLPLFLQKNKQEEEENTV